MADVNELLKDIELDEKVKKKISSKFSEVFKKYETDLADANGKLSEAIESRQKAKDKARELEEKLAKGDFDGANEIRNQLADYKKKSEDYETEVENLRKKSTELESFANKIKEQRKEELISKLPEGKLRDTASKIEDVELLSEHVAAIVESIGSKKKTFSARGSKLSFDIDEKKWSDLTYSQKEELEKENPELYNEIKQRG